MEKANTAQKGANTFSLVFSLDEPKMTREEAKAELSALLKEGMESYERGEFLTEEEFNKEFKRKYGF
jgi:predicted transcriptional regulator